MPDPSSTPRETRSKPHDSQSWCWWWWFKWKYRKTTNRLRFDDLVGLVLLCRHRPWLLLRLISFHPCKSAWVHQFGQQWLSPVGHKCKSTSYFKKVKIIFLKVQISQDISRFSSSALISWESWERGKRGVFFFYKWRSLRSIGIYCLLLFLNKRLASLDDRRRDFKSQKLAIVV